MKITLDIGHEQIASCVDGANIRYWTRRHTTEWDRETLALTVTEDEDGTVTRVDADRWAHALVLMATKHPKQFGEFLSGYGDSDVGDCLIQLAVFGELKYG